MQGRKMHVYSVGLRSIIGRKVNVVFPGKLPLLTACIIPDQPGRGFRSGHDSLKRRSAFFESSLIDESVSRSSYPMLSFNKEAVSYVKIGTLLIDAISSAVMVVFQAIVVWTCVPGVDVPIIPMP